MRVLAQLKFSLKRARFVVVVAQTCCARTERERVREIEKRVYSV